MALLHTDFEQIGEAHIHRLLAAKIAESRDIEYKRQPYGDTDADKAECLADISSFANTAGGDLLIGLAAKDGVPSGLMPLSGSADADALRIEELVRTGLQPRIQMHCKSIPLSAGGYLLLIRVPRSYNPPHRLVRNGKGQHRFYARSSGGKYELNVDELRALFTLAPKLAERLRDFRADRIARIVGGMSAAPLKGKDCIVLHIVPLSAFDLGASVPLSDLLKSSAAFPPLGSKQAQHQLINFDGALMLSNASAPNDPQRAYVQIFRSGAVEAVYSGFANMNARDGRPMMVAVDVEGTILNNGLKYLKSLSQMGVAPPFAVMLSLINVKGLTIRYTKSDWSDVDDLTLIDREHLLYGDVVIDRVAVSVQEFAKQIRPIIDQLANTAGLPASTSFDENFGYIRAWA